MPINAQINTDANGNLIVQMKGGLDYENGLPLRNQLLSIADTNPLGQITLDLHNVDFVGSSGIGIFVETLKIVNEKNIRIRLSNVKVEFIRVFKLYDLERIEELIVDYDKYQRKNLPRKGLDI